MRIPIVLAEQPRLHFADWRIAIVEKITSELGTLYYPANGWITVGVLQQWKHAGESRPFHKETIQLTDLKIKRHFYVLCHPGPITGL
jgi:hypothetical protein